MKNTFLKTIGGAALAILMLAIFAQVRVSAQILVEIPPQSEDIKGVFQTTVTQRNCQTGSPTGTFVGLLTFNEGGTLAETSTVLSPALRTPGHGVWSFDPNSQQYSLAFTFYRFNPDGTFAGRTVGRQTLTLAPGGNELTSSGTVQAFNAAGIQLGTGGCATSVATRFE